MREQKSSYFWLTLTAILGTIITALSIAAAPFAFDNPLFPNLPSMASLSALAVGSVVMAVAAFSVLKRQNSIKGGLSYSVALLAIGADLTLGNYLAGTLEIYYSVAIMAAFAAVGVLGLVYSSTQMKKPAENRAPLVEQPQATDQLEESKDNAREQTQELIITANPILSESKSNQNSNPIATTVVDSNISDRTDSQAQNNSSSSTDITSFTSNNSTPSTIAPSSVDSRPPSPTPSPPVREEIRIESPPSNEVKTTTTVQQATTPPSLIRTTTPSLTDSSDDERTQIDMNLETISRLLESAWRIEKRYRTTQNKDKIVNKIIETLELGAEIPLILKLFKPKKYNSDFIASFIEPFQKKYSEEIILQTLKVELKKRQKNEALEAIKIYFNTLQLSETTFIEGCKNIIIAIQDFGAKTHEISLILSNKFNDNTFMQEIIKHLQNSQNQFTGRLPKKVNKEIIKLMKDLSINIRLHELDQRRRSAKWNNLGDHYSSYTTPRISVPPKGYPPEEKPAKTTEVTIDKIITPGSPLESNNLLITPEVRLENLPQEEPKKKIAQKDIQNQLKEFAKTELTNLKATAIAIQLIESFFTSRSDAQDISAHLNIAKKAPIHLSNSHIKFLLDERFWEDHKLRRKELENRVIQRLLIDLLTSREEISVKKAEAAFIVENYLANLSAEIIADHLHKTFITSHQKKAFLNDYWPSSEHETLRQAVKEQILNKTPEPKTTPNEIKKKINNGDTQLSDTKHLLKPNYGGIKKESVASLETPKKLLTTFFKSPNTQTPQEVKRSIPVKNLLDNFSKPKDKLIDLTKELVSKVQGYPQSEITSILVNGVWNNQLKPFQAKFIVMNSGRMINKSVLTAITEATENQENLKEFLETAKNQDHYPIQPLVKLLRTYKLTDETLVNVLKEAHNQGYIPKNQIREIVVRYLELSLQEISTPESNLRYRAIVHLLPEKEPPVPEPEPDEDHIKGEVLRILGSADTQGGPC